MLHLLNSFHCLKSSLTPPQKIPFCIPDTYKIPHFSPSFQSKLHEIYGGSTVPTSYSSILPPANKSNRLFPRQSPPCAGSSGNSLSTLIF